MGRIGSEDVGYDWAVRCVVFGHFLVVGWRTRMVPSGLGEEY